MVNSAFTGQDYKIVSPTTLQRYEPQKKVAIDFNKNKATVVQSMALMNILKYDIIIVNVK